MRAFFDGLLSFAAAVATAALTLIPAYYAWMSIDAGFAPQWVWINISGLSLAAAVMIFVLLRKAKDGVAPLRARRRR
ncbi:MAG: hypothetical protein WBB85_20700 [Albidovulum sp.]|jgi:hypothetical protein|uniref:hypothetical protein n=1 Tax=Albidovulum sp. TaxID=1872424 RepID=UPI003C9012E5